MSITHLNRYAYTTCLRYSWLLINQNITLSMYIQQLREVETELIDALRITSEFKSYELVFYINYDVKSNMYNIAELKRMLSSLVGITALKVSLDENSYGVFFIPYGTDPKMTAPPSAWVKLNIPKSR